jgi:hypothetical protein
LWQEPTLSSFERDDEAEYPRVRKRDRDFAWLGSDLLRRVALFYTTNFPYSTRSWLADGEWVFELDTQREVQLNHKKFLDLLKDPVGGLPLRISQSHCSCDDPPLADDGWYMRQCTYHLVDKEGRPGGLQIRFRHRSKLGSNVREQLKRSGADPKWLDCVMPSSTANDSSEAFT